jgi:hypothetical protein
MNDVLPVHPAATTRFELNVGTMIQSLILMALVWVGTSVNTLTAQMAVVQSQMADVPELKKQVAALQIEVARVKARAGISDNTP